jgi:cell division septation protein DedD
MAMVLPPGIASAPPPASDKLPVVPLPAQNFLSLSPVVTSPRDGLTAAANLASTPNGPEASEGASGGYQLQVSSFRLQEEATKFSGALRKRGHRAHYESALVPGKGTWYRVRIGPFKSKLDAMRYRRDFEQREHMVPFLVEPVDKLPSAMARKSRLPSNPD